MLCLPNNPSGAVLTPEAAQAICDVLDEMWEKYYALDADGGFSIVLDEVYTDITAGKQVSLMQVCDRTSVVQR